MRGSYWWLDGQTERSIEDMRHEAVVTFLALLEMAKLCLITLTQHVREDAREFDNEEIVIARATEDLRARVEQTVARGDDYR